MNLIGKIFTVFILVMALVFGAFAPAVYVTHRNWRAVAQAKAKELDDMITARQADREKADAKIKSLQEELARKDKDLAREQTQNTELREARQANEKTIADLKVEVRDAIAMAKAAHEQMANYRSRVDLLTADLKQARADFDVKAREVQQLKDYLNSAQDEIARLQKRVEAVVMEIAKANECLRYFALNPNSDYKAKSPPVGTRGHILAVQGSDIVEIDLGSDVGIRKGHQLYVVRGATYCGVIEVVQVASDRAACRVVKEKLQKPMQREDNVLSELN
jgi:uncharacterized protein YlxW (UPF0749 family)